MTHETHVTAARLVRKPVRQTITLSRLMEESEQHLYGAAYSKQPDEELIATRILDNPQDFRRWEAEHAALMVRVVDERRGPAQASVTAVGCADSHSSQGAVRVLADGGEIYIGIADDKDSP